MMIEALPAVAMKVQVRCTGHLHNGELCNRWLATIDVKLWESKMLAGKLSIRCEKCGTENEFR